MKRILGLLFALLLVSCGPSEDARADLIAWGKEIGRLDKARIVLIRETKAYAQEMNARTPTLEDCDNLKEFAGRSADIYNEATTISPPEEARDLHNKYVVSFAKNADVDNFYALYVCEDDASYYDKYTAAVTESYVLAEDAYHDFKVFMEENSISCTDVDMCSIK